MRNSVNSLLSKLGLRLVRNRAQWPYIFPNHCLNNVYEIIYNDNGSGVLIQAPIDKGRGLPLFGYHETTTHPFVVAARLAMRQNYNRVSRVQGLLTEFYKLTSPKNPNDLLGIRSENPELNQLPAWAVVMPWQSDSTIEWKRKIASSVEAENYRYEKIGIEEGWAWTGPSTETKSFVEARRLVEVLESILAFGYKRHDGIDGDVVANILARSSKDWVWQSVGAQHRAAVMSALGEKSIPVRVRSVIRREDVSAWPHVVSKLYSEAEALQIFDDIFHARRKTISQSWDTFVAKNVI